MSGGIKSWPEGERPREKLLQQGASALSEAELLALIIGSGDAGSRRSALDLGRALLLEFGALRALADASCAEMQRVKGVGPAKATSIKAALELSSRFMGRTLESLTRYTSPPKSSNISTMNSGTAARSTSWRCFWTARTGSSSARRSPRGR